MMSRRPARLMGNPVSPAEARAFAQEKLDAALALVRSGAPAARAELAAAIGVWEGSTGERAPDEARRLLTPLARS